jgi:nucleoside phosphorylase/CheY-like chemotaxis protein
MSYFKILLVEDNEYWQDILKEDINKAVDNIGQTESIVELIEYFNKAYKILKDNVWDLLVTDIGLGGANESHQKRGVRLVKLALQKQIPAIVVSGTPSVTTQDVRNLLMQHKASDFFSKADFDDDKFIAKIQEILQNNSTNSADERPLSLNETIPDKSEQESFQPSEHLIDFAIITAIELERKAVCKAFGLTDNNRVFKESRVYWRGRLNLKDGESYEIVVAQSPDMANVDAALLTSDTIHHWHPESLLMVGIAGAASEEEKLGDLILGSSVYYYERGKVKPDGNKPEPHMYPSDATLWSRVTSRKWTGRIPVKRPDGTKERPKIYQGVIASGEKVIADAAVRDEIAAGHRKIKAIEMEGYGFSKAAWQSFDRVRHLVIRAICDRADSSKSDEWHPYAAAVAAEFTKHFLSDRPLEPRNSSNRT